MLKTSEFYPQSAGAGKNMYFTKSIMLYRGRNALHIGVSALYEYELTFILFIFIYLFIQKSIKGGGDIFSQNLLSKELNEEVGRRLNS